MVRFFDRDLGYSTGPIARRMHMGEFAETITSSTELFVDFQGLAGPAGTPAGNMIPSFGTHSVPPGDLVLCLVAVEKLPDDALSKQALLTAKFTRLDRFGFVKKRVVSELEEKPVHCFLLQP
jgi:hypothetical protein